MAKEIISVPEYPVSPFPQSTAIRTDELLWVSGQMATDYKSGIASETASPLAYQTTGRRL